MAKKQLKVIERKLGREQAIAQTFTEDGLIEIDPRLSAKGWIYALLHEVLHNACPDMEEKEVRRVSKILANNAWKHGIRRVHMNKGVVLSECIE